MLQTYGHVLQQVSVQPPSAGLQPPSAGLQPSPPAPVSILQPPPEAPLVPDPAVDVPKLLLPPGEMAKVVEEMSHSIGQTEAFMQQLQQVRASMSFLSLKVCLGEYFCDNTRENAHFLNCTPIIVFRSIL